MTDSIEQFLSKLHHPALASVDLKLDRMVRLLSLLGSPQKRLPPVIHVAGTNGKGSLIAYLQGVFEAAGYRVHRYTSPHLVRFSERIVLQGREIENAYLEKLLKHIAPILQTQPATFFEATTALAFLAFAEKPADIFLMETGCGGRLDATNVVDKPLLTAITPVSFDHMEYLGKTIAAIAAEKAGILKGGISCVVGRQADEASEVIERRAAEVKSPLYRLGKEWQVNGDVYESAQRNLKLTPSLVGKHQFDNAATAVACIEQLPQFSISDAQITRGLASAVWPARLQKISQGKLRDILPPGIELWLDGGHNPQGGEVLAEWFKEQNKPIYLVCGMIKGKEMASYLKPLAPYVQRLLAIQIPDEYQSQPAAQVEAAARQVGIDAASAPSLQNALQTIAAHAKTPAIICICGSLYLAGKVLAANEGA